MPSNDPYDVLVALLGKYRHGPMDNAALAKAILRRLKNAKETDRQRCGHDVAYFDNGECIVCKTKEVL